MKHIPRFFVEHISDSEVFLSAEQMHHAVSVLRLREDDNVCVFNSTSGEWLCTIKSIKKNSVIPIKQKRKFEEERGPSIACSLINPNRFSILLEKITELGVTEIFPIVTEFTQYRSINEVKLQRTVVQACEQSERMSIPKIHKLISLEKFLNSFPLDRKLLIGIERENTTRIIDCLSPRCTFLIGPEGGFSDKEKSLFFDYDFVNQFHFGQNILRSETAAIAFIAAWVSRYI